MWGQILYYHPKIVQIPPHISPLVACARCVQVIADMHASIHQHFEPGQRVVFCGHSMGGRVAMAYAAKYPEDIAALIIEDIDIKAR